MPTMQDVRAKFPQYNDLSDGQLAEAIHRKFYADMPQEEFAARIGLAPQAGGKDLIPDVNLVKSQYDSLPAWQKPIIAADDIATLIASGALMGFGEKGGFLRLVRQRQFLADLLHGLAVRH